MERFTTRCGGVALIADSLEGKYKAEQVIDILAERLAAYEDTGRDPEEIVAMRHTLVEYHKEADPLLRAKIEGRLVVLPSNLRRLEELVKADKEGRVLQYAPGDTVYDRYGMAWTVTEAEIHKFADGKLRHLYRCGHHGTDDYRALYSDEIQPAPEAGA